MSRREIHRCTENRGERTAFGYYLLRRSVSKSSEIFTNARRRGPRYDHAVDGNPPSGEMMFEYGSVEMQGNGYEAHGDCRRDVSFDEAV